MGPLRIPKGNPDTIVDACELAACLGLHRRTVCRWIARGRLRAHRLGAVRSRLRVRLADFRAFLLTWHSRGINRMIGQALLLEPGERQRPSAWRGRTDRRLMR